MGQYHVLVNFDRREFVFPHDVGDGLKLWEQGASVGGVCSALLSLLAVSNGRGGGDFLDGPEHYGAWAGDRLAVVGDYGTPGDLPADIEAEFGHAGEVYEAVGEAHEGVENGWRNISGMLSGWLEQEFTFRFEGDGWRRRVDVG